MAAVIDKDLCNGCGTCDNVCPGDVIHFDDDSGLPVVKYPDECWYCGSCRADCPTGAIRYVFPVQVL